MYILKNQENVVVAKAESYSQEPNGIKMGSVIYGEPDLILEETDKEVQIQRDMIVDGEVLLNPDYQIY